MIKAGLLIFIAAWVPLIVVGLLHPDSNPVGFGILAWLGSLIGLIIVAIGLFRWTIRRVRHTR